jgi:ribose transport system substrate-binding protein
MISSGLRRAVAAAAVAGSCVALAACGSSNKDDNGSAASASSGSSTTATAGGAAGVAAATKAIAPLEQGPSPFNVTEPLRKLPTGAKIAYMQCGAPECAYIAGFLKQAAAAMGVNVNYIKTGATAQTITAAFNSAIQLKPAAVLVPALDPITWPKQLAELKSKKIPVIAWTIPPQPDGRFTKLFLTGADNEQVGKLEADYIIAKSGGKAKIVYYYAPEYTVFAGAAARFQQEIKSACPACTISVQKAPAAQIGTTFPSRLVSYLQQHGDTQWVAMAFGSLMLGVPQALQKAGLASKVQTISQAGGSDNFSYIKAGQQTVDLSLSLPILTWSVLDSAARAITGQPDPNVKLGDSGILSTQPPIEFITKDKVTWGPHDTFVGFDNYQARFKKLWGVG